jgi:hypothetical protein
MNSETLLLYNTLLYEDGHSRRTQHILKVYALSKLLSESENLNQELQLIIRSAAILHDIAIKHCKEKYNNASQELQRKEAPLLVKHMLEAANYAPSFTERITTLVLKHHCYDCIEGIDCQILIEADLLINLFEEPALIEQIPNLSSHFKTSMGLKLLNIFTKGELQNGEDKC